MVSCKSQSKKLPRVQNIATKLVFNKKKNETLTGSRKLFCRIITPASIEIKLIVLVYKYKFPRIFEKYVDSKASVQTHMLYFFPIFFMYLEASWHTFAS